MSDLGLQAYRFSVSWSRIQADESGGINSEGLAFYDRLVDGLLERGIEPWLTLYHWDLPLWMHRLGGWQNRDVSLRFAEYAQVMAQALGDRVKNWMTLNEPWCSAILGYETGEHAPGLRLGKKEVLAVCHHHLLAHGLGVQALRAQVKDLKIGIVLNPTIPLPLSDSEQDLQAAEWAWQERVGWWCQPLYHGGYPEVVAEHWREALPDIEDHDFAVISESTDFLGLNLYFPDFVTAPTPRCELGYLVVSDRVLLPRTDMGWPIYPPLLAFAVPRIARDYTPGPFYMTESGCAVAEPERGAEVVHDLGRQEYLRTHLDMLLALREQGIDIRGYFAWSLLDNFEWQFGYCKRFGLIRVDYESQSRTPKASADWYRRCIAQGRLLYR